MEGPAVPVNLTPASLSALIMRSGHLLLLFPTCTLSSLAIPHPPDTVGAKEDWDSGPSTDPAHSDLTSWPGGAAQEIGRRSMAV